MKMHVLCGGGLKMRKSTYIPGADRSAMIELPVSSTLLRHAQGNVLFDTGCHPSIAENPEPRLRGTSRFMIPIMSQDDNAVTGLNCIGLEPDDNSGEYLLASDALSIRENLDRDIIPRNTWNPELCAQSFAEIRRIEAGGAKIICSHDAAQWDSLRKGVDAYD